MASPNWFKWGWYFTLTVESGVQYPSTDLKWGTVESDFLLPQDRLYGGGVGIIQFTSENFELLRRIVRNGYDMSAFPDGTIKSNLVNGVKTIDWFKSSRSPGGGLFNRDETVEIKKMLESSEGMESQAFFNDKYFNINNKTAMNNIKNSSLDDDLKAFLVNIVVLRPASVSAIIAMNPTNLDDIVAKTLSIPQLSGYGSRMNSIADGLKMVNINDEPPIDIDNMEDTDKPEPKPDPPDNSVIEDEFDKITGNIIQNVEKLLTRDIYYYGSDKTIANANIKVTKVMNNMYKIKLTDVVKDIFMGLLDKGSKDFNEVVEEDNQTYPPENPIPPKEDPTSEKFFPVDVTRQGVNFWTPPYNINTNLGKLKHNMDFGLRTGGKQHYGYDIGGGNINHNIYAVTSGEVITVGVINGYGSVIQIKHSTDNYYSLYAHLVSNSNTVQKGDLVTGGQKIAVMGNSGGNYKIHLHIEISEKAGTGANANVIDPKGYLEITDDNRTELKNPS